MKNIIIIFCLIFLQVYGDQKIISHFKDLVLMPKFLQTQQDNQKVIDGDTLTNPTPAPTPTTQPAVNPEDNPDPQYKLFPMIIALSSGKQELQAQKELGNLLYDEPDYVVLKKTERSQQRLYYVQGFKFLNKNTIIESSGLYGESVMHLLDSETFQETKSVDLDQNHFGEGSDWIKNSNGIIEIHQMTYKERDIYVYDQDLQLLNTFKMPETMKEGWGLARSPDGKRFYATDGTDRVFVVKPDTWEIEKTFNVFNEEGQHVYKLNDLGFIKDKLFIIIYLTRKLIQVDPQSGKILKTYDFSTIVEEFMNSKLFQDNGFNAGHCLNGIAYCEETDRLLITGKKWPSVYEIKLKNVV